MEWYVAYDSSIDAYYHTSDTEDPYIEHGPMTYDDAMDLADELNYVVYLVENDMYKEEC